jgi:leucyl-tRNA synthetase
VSEAGSSEDHGKNSGELDYSYNVLVKKATSDFEALSFNTTIAQMMVFVNDCYKCQEPV